MRAGRAQAKRSTVPRAFSRPRATTAMFVATALLFASASLGAPAMARAQTADELAFLKAVGSYSAISAHGHLATASIASNTPPVAHKLPRPRPPRVQPGRLFTAPNEKTISGSGGSHALAAEQVDHGSRVAVGSIARSGKSNYLTHASKSSRTRGQPVTDL